ncbi:MAG: N-formylglutamate amidohydrolase [Inquilinaceae bacterium]
MTAFRAAGPAAPSPSLIGPDDPPPFSLVNPDGKARVLLVADHAGAAIPASMDRLGLGDAPMERHIAYDIGIGWLTGRLATLLDAPAMMHNYSRLLIDPNRPLDDPTSICAISDGVIVPGNRHVTAAEAAARAASFFHPYHQAVDAAIGRWLDRGVAPAIVSLHSFTPEMRGFPRPWQVGILWGKDGRMAEPLIAALARDPALCVGDNEPYSGLNMHGYTIETHALARGLANVLIEVRQDQIETESDAHAWADRLAAPLAAILDDEVLYRAVTAV